MFGDIPYNVIGEPNDIGSANQLAQDDRYQFQWWAGSLIKAKPLGGKPGSKVGKKGSDKGIDGEIIFLDDAKGSPKKILVQVKSGKVKSGDIRDLAGTVGREKAAMGVFITLDEPSPDMITEAVSAGFYESTALGHKFPKLQILTIAELLDGATVKMPQSNISFKTAERVKPDDKLQMGLFDDQ
jgi:site-specific DNA-methyltransferase (adenine-specific)